MKYANRVTSQFARADGVSKRSIQRANQVTIKVTRKKGIDSVAERVDIVLTVTHTRYTVALYKK